MLPDQWEQIRRAANAEAGKRQQLGTLPEKAALHLLSLLVMTVASVKGLAALACFSAMTLMVGLTGCSSDRHHQSPGHRFDDRLTAEPGDHQSTDQTIEDKRTAERVREALAAGADYKFDGVKVTACHGVVQLSGFVNTSARQTSAGALTSKVPGVKGVENNLAVKD